MSRSQHKTEFDIHPLDAPLGVEVRNLDLTTLPTPEVAAGLRRLISEHCCVLVRSCEISEEQHVAFANHMGQTVVPWLHAVELDTISHAAELPTRPGYTGAAPGVIYFCNGPGYRDKPDDGYLQNWHADMVHLQVPLSFGMLHSIRAPETGYETWYSNQYAAYENLDSETKRLADGLMIEHSFKHIFPRLPAVVHPLILEHPLTQRRTIYGVPGTAATDPQGLSGAQSAALMKQLTRHLDDDRFIYKHRWRTGDTMFWDNRCVLHRRGPQVGGQARIMRRVIFGDGTPHEVRHLLTDGA